MTRIALPPVGGSMGEKLREARLKKGWGQVGAAMVAGAADTRGGVGFAEAVPRAYELDKRVFPDRAIVAALAQLLDLDADDLLSRTGWGRDREQMRGYPKTDTAFIHSPSPTMAELLRVVDRLSETQLERVLQYAREQEGR